MTNLDRYKQCEQSYSLCKEDLKFLKKNLDKYRILYINEVIDKISKITEVKVSDIVSKVQNEEYVNAKVAIIKIAYEHIKNYSVIAKELNRSHVTIMFHQKKYLKYFPEIAEIIKKYHEK